MTESYFTPKKPYRILIVVRRRRTSERLAEELGDNVEVSFAGTADTALQMLGLEKYDLVIIQLQLPLFSGLDLARELRRIKKDLAVLSFCPPGMTREMEEIVRLGYPLPFIFTRINILDIVKSCREHLETAAFYHRIDDLSRALANDYRFNRMLSVTDEIHDIYHKLAKISDARVPILITGESGTGKELVAQMIHHTSNRHNKPFIPVSCAAVPENLLESQFFGHEKGAFTGAVNRAVGKFELANEGVLFLDEIGEMSPLLQAKLLRVLEYEKFERVGGSEVVNVDVRLITATNRNLDQMVEKGDFREDLLYRINAFPIHLPPLREREGDINLLAYHFLRQAGIKNNRIISCIVPDALDLLHLYPWHGNVRELENAIERAIFLSDGTKLKIEDFPRQLDWYRSRDDKTETEPLKIDTIDYEVRPLKDVEREAIQIALRQNNWNIAQTARQLGISRNTLYRKIEEHELQVPKPEESEIDEEPFDGDI